tara:strand:- start:2426 stop:2800 length:375 start_codon:yes stop_codon:yes gene_type:complete
MSMTTNPREKHPGTQRQYLDLKVSTTVHQDTSAGVVAAPPAGYCINIWGVFAICGGAAIAGWDITDGADTAVTVAANKYTSMNITYPMPIKFAEATALGITDPHGIIQDDEVKVTVIYYTIVPV